MRPVNYNPYRRQDGIMIVYVFHNVPLLHSQIHTFSLLFALNQI